MVTAVAPALQYLRPCQIFGVPPQARKAKPFVDHILTFSIVDNKIWFRNFQVSTDKIVVIVYRSLNSCVQIIEKDPLQPNGPPQMSLVEIGPRFVLTPIRIFEGAFNGATVYSNPGIYTFPLDDGHKLTRNVLRQNSSPLPLSVLRSNARRGTSMVTGSMRRRSAASARTAGSWRRTIWLYRRSSRSALQLLRAAFQWSCSMSGVRGYLVLRSSEA